MTRTVAHARNEGNNVVIEGGHYDGEVVSLALTGLTGYASAFFDRDALVKALQGAGVYVPEPPPKQPRTVVDALRDLPVGTEFRIEGSPLIWKRSARGIAQGNYDIPLEAVSPAIHFTLNTNVPGPDARAVVRGLDVGTKFRFKGTKYLKVSNGSVVDLETAQIVKLTVTFAEKPGRKVRVVREAPKA